ncbi:acyl-CoA dehydrogenase [Thalassospira profundimaris]|uniref:Acyl-[acyl-carrier-protein] dehydrogenase MbtN n=1 Tax=Thalassospira profundimaris TaxID=502049 RepID=A0A367WIF2_9PROT|nr:acyl-CoA dehydrogenase family protein [Thalassospira profundimaris]RCK41009.1 acyl-CoA dehydrogenase [Thalassospira profundimaris]
MPIPYTRTIYEAEHQNFRETVRRFLADTAVPRLEKWRAQGHMDRDFWKLCGELGILCPSVPENYGGVDANYLYNAIISEEMGYSSYLPGVAVHSDVNVTYLLHHGTEAQKERWLPGMVSGDVITSIGMTEPGTGSDLRGIRTTAMRDGDSYIVNGAKLYITNGYQADLILLVVKTNPDAGSKSLSILLVEGNTPGLIVGKPLKKAGLDLSDTMELTFDNMRVPAENLLGEEGAALHYMMAELPRERISIAVASQAQAQRAFDLAVSFTKDRKAFGTTVFDLQNTRFKLAECQTDLQVGWAHLDWALARHVRGELTTAEACAAKLYHTNLLDRVADVALQLHGGAGYMSEYEISHIWRDARIQRIYGGTDEIMKDVVARSI